MKHRLLRALAPSLLLCWKLGLAAEPARILTNHIGYETFGAKRAVIQGSGSDDFARCAVRGHPDGTLAFEAAVTPATRVADWRDWQFWTFDFSALQREGEFVIECADNGDARGSLLRSFPFKLQHDALERATLSNVVAYFKAQRVSGEFDRADRKVAFADDARAPIDAHGGWYDATGDYGVHLSQLDFSSYFNTQQVPLVVYALGRSLEMLDARGDRNYNQIKRRLVDEMSWGADFLVRIHREGRSFYQTINAPGPGKKAEDRRIGPAMTSFGIKKSPDDSNASRRDGMYEVSFRSGGGFAIAALALAARHGDGEFDRAAYLAHAESAFAFLDSHNAELTNDGVENIVDDYCALAAASELLRATGKEIYASAARKRAESLLARLVSDGKFKDYWRADGKERPFFNPADAGAPVVTLLRYLDLADAPLQARIKAAVRRSLEHELAVTAEVANPFGLARQTVQSKGKGRRNEFFFPHDTETGEWWQGENARLGSLATAARLAANVFDEDPVLQNRLRGYADDQINWILGLNPFDASMLHGSGRNNPEYGFFDSWQYSNFPGGIVNGITSGFADDRGIDFNLMYAQTGKDADWRWGEQWLPHSSWYLLALAADKPAATTTPKVVIGYVFVEDKLVDAAKVPAEKLSHINYAFANIKDGVMVEGFRNDTKNFARLRALKQRNPQLKVLVSVGGWTWSGQFSDMALTAQSRARFIDSALAFVQRHQLDGLDIDWEYPGQKGMDNIHRPEDRENFTALLTELRAAFDRADAGSGRHTLLTIASGANADWITHTQMDQVQAQLDYVNLMAYDQFGPWDDGTGHNAPLFTHPDNPKQLSAASVVDLYVQAGVPPRKIVLGVPFYGKVWGQVPAARAGLYQPAPSTPVKLDTVYASLKANTIDRAGFVRHWDERSGVPFLYNAQRNVFVSYDDPQSMQAKSRYVNERGLAGVMFWELGGDPSGELVEAIRSTLKP
ncbi:MAG: glycoside hydrolase family 9 protein [Dokdonella sp.]|uniref:glycosyl hydrolase family 18 protein n=1 Tax=Dokdonella sp. TaxID=2291710 RepID=UPI0025C58DEB|nr:glycosyl hydrolase family 18 protein [Dokdonella sp.]MBZ0221510.1 glycoside hydrolase family 9 protein [Dokdonella sp.]